MPTTQLHKIKVKLSDGQKRNLARAYGATETITLRLKANALTGNDTLLVPASVARRLERNGAWGEGMDIWLAKTNIGKQVGGGLQSFILPVVKTFGPMLAKTLG